MRLAKKLVDKNCSGMDSDALCDAMWDASDALGRIIDGLEPLGRPPGGGFRLEGAKHA
jgi:hypothetical protein